MDIVPWGLVLIIYNSFKPKTYEVSGRFDLLVKIVKLEEVAIYLVNIMRSGVRNNVNFTI